MSPEQQRMAIAKACGWHFIQCGARSAFPGLWRLIPPDHNQIVAERFADSGQALAAYAPDYLNDLNAAHEMEAVLLNEQRRTYVELLIATHPLHYDFRTSDDSRMAAYFIVTATAAQRAEAFLKTLGLWEEPK